MKNSKFLSLLFILTLFTPLFSNASLREHSLHNSKGEAYYALSNIEDVNRPTLIFLPGIYRGFLKDEEFLNLLTLKKINWVAWHTSRHPQSVLVADQVWLKPVTTEDLAQELLSLKQALKIKQPVVVSLSYSATITAALNPRSFPVVIETAPMGQDDETTPTSDDFKNWENFMNLIPVWGNWMVQTQEYWAYRGFWTKETASLTESHPEYQGHETVIAEGLAQLAYAGKGFDLRTQNFAKGPKRFWILGQKENRGRKSTQMEAIALYEEQTGHKNSAFEIQKAGHVIPSENPEAYVKLLSQLVGKLAK